VIASGALLSLALARNGVRGLRGEAIRARPGGGLHRGGRAAVHGAARLALGMAGLALAAWLAL